MKENILYYCVIVSSLFIASCSKNDDSLSISPKNNNEQVITNDSISYQFKLKLCDTGKHTFTKKKDYCDALQDEALNNFCALRERQELHSYNCTEFGQFISKNEKQTLEPKPQKPVEDFIKPKMYEVQINSSRVSISGLELCVVNNLIIFFSSEDNMEKQEICRNDQLEFYALSNLGIVTFHVKDLLTESELLNVNMVQRNKLVLGKKNDLMINTRYSYDSYYVQAKDITNFRKNLLSEWNLLFREYHSLKMEEMNELQRGKFITNRKQKRIARLVSDMNNIQLEMELLRNN
jgi:hypothetical protein